jgi:hypothetical protein
MTIINGNTNDGGAGTGTDGHRCYVDYSYTQNIVGNYTDVTWGYGVNYGDPNYWNNISNRSVAWTVNVGASVSTVSGFGTGTSSAPVINTSDPGYGGQSHIFWTGVVRLTHNSSGQGTIHLAAAMDFSSSTYTSSISSNIAFPDIVQAPTAPTTLTATRINDGQINLAWTNTSTSHHEYANVKVYRSTNGGSYSNIATLGVVTSYSDTTTTTDSKYTYKVQAVNAAGTADSSASSAVYTTPDTPGTPVATKLGTGNIQLDWTNNVSYGDTAYTTRIEHSADGGAFSELDSVSGGVATYVHVSPNPAQTHTYKIRARSTTGSLNSSYTANSNTIVLLSTANAPTNLAPSGVAKDATENIILTWTHNPTDGTPQSKRRVQTKVDAGSYSDAVNDSSSTSSYTITGGTFTNGHTITWKAATAGQNGTLSAFSSESSFTTSARPTATLASLASYSSSTLTAGFTYFQAQSSAQATWRGYLYDVSNNLLESKTGTTTTSINFTTALTDATTYTVVVYVTSAVGLESLIEDQTFTTDFLPPATSYISAAYDSLSGTIVLSVSADGPTGGVTVAVTSMDIQRQIDGGEWINIVTGYTFDGSAFTIIDTKPTIAGSNNYRVLAHSAVPTSGYSAEDEEVVAEEDWSFLSTGTGFQDIVRMKAAPTFSSSAVRERVLYHFAGRVWPVQFIGEAQNLQLSISGTLTDNSSTPEEFEAMAYSDAIVLWRDPSGRRVFGSMGQVQTSRTSHILSTVSFDVTEVDYDE